MLSTPNIPSNYSISPDGKHLAYVTTIDDKQCVVVDGKPGALYDSIEREQFSGILFNQNGTRYAYVARQGDRYVVVADGAESESYDQIPCSDMVFSPDGSHFAYTGYENGHAYVVRDGVKGKAYRRIIGSGLYGMFSGLQYSNDSEHLLYVAQDISGKQIVVIDDRTEGPYLEVLAPVFSPDSAHVAYGAKHGNSWNVVYDGISGKAYQSLFGGKSAIVFSSDGRHYAYSAKQNSKWTVVVDGQEGESFDSMGMNVLAFGPNNLCVYTAERGDQYFLVNGGKASKVSYVYNICVSPDKKHLAVRIACNGKQRKQMILFDGKPGKEYDDRGSYDLCFSPDSRRLAYIARSGEKTLVVADGVAGKLFDSITSPLTFSKNSVHLAYIVENYKVGKYVVLDGKPGKKYDRIANNVTFSPDGNHLAYIVNSNDTYRLVMDGVESPAYDMILGNDIVTFYDTALYAFALRGKEVLKIKISTVK
ncbi:MAG: WD40 repeat domain-containing protein [Armatimonadota bacterium]